MERTCLVIGANSDVPRSPMSAAPADQAPVLLTPLSVAAQLAFTPLRMRSSHYEAAVSIAICLCVRPSCAFSLFHQVNYGTFHVWSWWLNLEIASSATGKQHQI